MLYLFPFLETTAITISPLNPQAIGLRETLRVYVYMDKIRNRNFCFIVDAKANVF